MCVKCIFNALAGIKEVPVGTASTLALKEIKTTEIDLKNLEEKIKLEVDAAIAVIRQKHEATFMAIEKRRISAWDLVKTQLGLDPNAECDIHVQTGQVRQVVKEVPQ